MLAPFRWRVVNNYAATGNNQTEPMVYMHRLIMQPPDGMVIDHINGNKLDNRKCNMRVCTDLQNRFNNRPRRASQSQLKGVYERWIPASGSKSGRSVYDASIRVNGKKRHIGTFQEKIDAVTAYNEAAKAAFGEFAYTNPTENLVA